MIPARKYRGFGNLGCPISALPAFPERPADAMRCLALDAFRGFFMILLISSGFGIGRLSGCPALRPLAAQFNHCAWVGLTFWDLVLPAFLFTVGAALPFAMAARAAQGLSRAAGVRHAAARSAKLLVLAVVVTAVASGQLQVPYLEVLFHIALASFACFLIAELELRWQALCAAGVLAVHLSLYLLFPGADGAFTPTGNAGAAIDRGVFGASYPGHYSSLNILPAIVTTLTGSWAARLVRGARPQASKLAVLCAAAVGAVALGLALSPWVPVIKRIYTLSYTLISVGCVAGMFSGFFWLIEMRGWRRWTFPLVVVGTNCLLVYSVAEMLGPWLNGAVAALAGGLGYLGAFAPMAQNCGRLCLLWYLCYWLYRRRIVVKL